MKKIIVCMLLIVAIMVSMCGCYGAIGNTKISNQPYQIFGTVTEKNTVPPIIIVQVGVGYVKCEVEIINVCMVDIGDIVEVVGIPYKPDDNTYKLTLKNCNSVRIIVDTE